MTSGFPATDGLAMMVAAAVLTYERTQMEGIGTVSKVVGDFGALTAFFIVALAFMAFYLFYLYPKEMEYRRNQDIRDGEQLAAVRLALETSNEVIKSNTRAMEANAMSHERLGERMGGVEDAFVRHDHRAEGMCTDIAVIKAAVEKG